MMETTELLESETAIQDWVKSSKKKPGSVIGRVERLPGDASTRRYYRIHLAPQGSAILMKTEPFVSEGTQLPFLVVQAHLTRGKVDVPQILDVDPTLGFVLLEDLGDDTLLRALQGVTSPDIERHLYERVIDGLVQLQVACAPGAPEQKGFPELDAFRLKFDLEKLMWEVDFTIEHFYRGYLKRVIPAADLEAIRSGFTEICKELEAEPSVFTHRDFHSRNVMAIGERMVMIDFQDARMGPAQYDLASLLKDSYYQLEDAQIDRLIDYYTARYEALSGVRLDRPHFRRIFDLMAVQRNFKAIGSFASFLVKRGDPSYLKYIGNTFENLRRSLLKYPRFHPLRELLFHYYYF